MNVLTAPPDADDATALALLNCLVREIIVPAQRAGVSGDWLELGLPRTGTRLRARLTRPPFGPGYRLAMPVQARSRDWTAVGWDELATLIAQELNTATGQANSEFLGQVRSSRDAMAALRAARLARIPGGDVYLESEQSLLAGHRFHPTPKDRQGVPADWLAYAPEAGARFPLRWLAIRDHMAAQEGDPGALDLIAPPVPGGFLPLPVHPWQYALLAGHPLLRAALAADLVRDLGLAGPQMAPTASVRTVYAADHDLFLKFSMDVRITNCLRRNAWYELTGAVTLTRLLKPVFARLSTAFGGCVLLGEPGYRTAALADRHLYEGLGVLVRDGLGTRREGTPLLAAALADPHWSGAGLPDGGPDGALAWWDAYVRLVAPPVLHAYLRYGVVLEPHLQNVLIRVRDGLPVQAIFRDLEGTKLLPGFPGSAALPTRVRSALTYQPDQGWNRVLYCLFVNHLTEVAARLADRHPHLEPALWRRAHKLLTEYGSRHLPEGSARLRALLSGAPLPAKANLLTRWTRSPDRDATYVQVPSPFS